MDLGDLNKVWEIKALKKKPAADEAQKTLEKIAKQVQPIMKKHKWRVKVLSEFCPNNPNLLGLNVGGGVHVKLRLRKANRDLDFIPYNQVLDTMLHELCHNAHGPHNASFYKLWDDIRKECEELISKGVTGTGEGFDSTGRRLGGYSRQPPLSSLRKTALTAAQKRAQLGALLPTGPNRLGGNSDIMGALSPIQAAAMAAERRLQDELWCGSQSIGISDEGESSSSGPAQAIPQGPKRSIVPETSGLVSKKKRRVEDDIVPETIFIEDDDIQEKATWECRVCTLFNPCLAPICEACGNQKPKDVKTKYKIWSCKFCTLENNVKLDKCSACGQWRYSHGAPISSQLNLGT